MKTFEERYTAWIDGQLESSALAAFEQELARRAAAGEAEADRQDTLRLRHLLRSHLEAPTLNNPEFFSHQLRERLNAESATPTRRAQTAGAGGGFLSSLFPWSLARLAGTGAACLFVAAALYYGLEPGPGTPRNATVAKNTTVPAVTPVATPEQAVAAVTPAPTKPRDPSDPLVVASNNRPPPAPFDDSPDIQVHPPQMASPASATPLLYAKPNVNVLWTDGLNYLPDVPTPGAGATPAAPAASAAP